MLETVSKLLAISSSSPVWGLIRLYVCGADGQSQGLSAALRPALPGQLPGGGAHHLQAAVPGVRPHVPLALQACVLVGRGGPPQHLLPPFHALHPGAALLHITSCIMKFKSTTKAYWQSMCLEYCQTSKWPGAEDAA